MPFILFSGDELSGQGCYYQYKGNDVFSNAPRDFPNDITLFIDPPMRPEKCIEGCRDNGFDYAALQVGVKA